MTPLFKKLNLGAHRVVHVLDAPTSFEPELAALEGVTLHRRLAGRVGFAMAFVVTQAELDAACSKLVAACEGDAVLWMVYPKGSSKKYRCEFNRDSGWPALGAAGLATIWRHAENSDVVPPRVAVAVRNWPAATAVVKTLTMAALPPASSAVVPWPVLAAWRSCRNC